MKKHFLPHAPVRIFAFSITATLAALIGTFFGLGASAFFVAVILIIVEITFSFENAIINAKILRNLSKFWQNIFLTIGIFIAIFGMRIIFPIAIVMVTAGLSATDVIDLALNKPDDYAKELNAAHPQIAAFGGAFLLMLALHFFLDDSRKTLWFTRLERKLQQFATRWMPAAAAFAIIALLSVLPFNHHQSETIIAGTFGIVLYSAMQALIHLFERIKPKEIATTKPGEVIAQTGMTAFLSFIYLEILDASFSFDGVIGAFAVTNDVVLIAIGLGVGAIWVRSLTVFMVRNGTLDAYRYLEHGAHYTVFVLSAVLLLGIFYHVPEVLAGLVGIGLIGSAIVSSRQATKAEAKQ